MTVGEKIRLERQKLGYSVRLLSERSGIARSTISRWENNQLNPSEGKLKVIIEALGISTAEFWSEPLGYVRTQANDNANIREQINRIVRNLGDIQIAVNILREHYGIEVTMVQKLGSEDCVYFSKGIDRAAKAMKRKAVEKERGFEPLCRKEFRYDWCDFIQHPKKEQTHKYE